MHGVIIAMLPAMAVSFFVFGLGSVLVTLIAVVSCIAFEYLITRYLLHRPSSIWDGSAIITGILLAFNVPSNLPWWTVIIGSLVAVGVGKMAFGGLGNNPFNPCIGRAGIFVDILPCANDQLAAAFRIRLSLIDATTGATPLAVIKEGLNAGRSVSELMGEIPGYLDLFLGGLGGSIGEISGPGPDPGFHLHAL